ncbi:MAG: DUF1801 domain-containing protein [Balneolaceae bacterium]|nr:DUF1801 domain-containing protein [Balneolaceae bacterium]
MSTNKSKTIDDYINTFPKDVQRKLQKIRKTIQKAIPEANEEMKWNRPAFVDGRILVMFGGFKNHIGFYSTPSTLEEFEDELKSYRTGSGSIQFPYNEPLPTELITKITQYRDWESKKKGVNWKS